MAYSKEEREEICRRVIEYVSRGDSLRKACKHPGMPSEGIVRHWTVEDPEFFTQYARAREARAEARADKIDELTDEVRSGKLDANAARVIIDAEKWQAGKENPKRFGDKLTLDGDLNVKTSDEQLDARIAQLLGKAGVVSAPGGAGEEE